LTFPSIDQFQTMPSTTPKIYAVDQIEKAIATPGFRDELIEGIRQGFVALEHGEFFAPPIQTLGLPPFEFVQAEGYAAQTCIKTGYFKGQDHYVVKVASGGYPLESTSHFFRLSDVARFFVVR
jgi:ornithine cyclodeaminase